MSSKISSDIELYRNWGREIKYETVTVDFCLLWKLREWKEININDYFRGNSGLLAAYKVCKKEESKLLLNSEKLL